MGIEVYGSQMHMLWDFSIAMIQIVVFQVFKQNKAEWQKNCERDYFPQRMEFLCIFPQDLRILEPVFKYQIFYNYNRVD